MFYYSHFYNLFRSSFSAQLPSQSQGKRFIPNGTMCILLVLSLGRLHARIPLLSSPLATWAYSINCITGEPRVACGMCGTCVFTLLFIPQVVHIMHH